MRSKITSLFSIKNGINNTLLYHIVKMTQVKNFIMNLISEINNNIDINQVNDDSIITESKILINMLDNYFNINDNECKLSKKIRKLICNINDSGIYENEYNIIITEAKLLISILDHHFNTSIKNKIETLINDINNNINTKDNTSYINEGNNLIQDFELKLYSSSNNVKLPDNIKIILDITEEVSGNVNIYNNISDEDRIIIINKFMTSVSSSNLSDDTKTRLFKYHYYLDIKRIYNNILDKMSKYIDKIANLINEIETEINKQNNNDFNINDYDNDFNINDMDKINVIILENEKLIKLPRVIMNNFDIQDTKEFYIFSSDKEYLSSDRFINNAIDKAIDKSSNNTFYVLQKDTLINTSFKLSLYTKNKIKFDFIKYMNIVSHKDLIF